MPGELHPRNGPPKCHVHKYILYQTNDKAKMACSRSWNLKPNWQILSAMWKILHEWLQTAVANSTIRSMGTEAPQSQMHLSQTAKERRRFIGYPINQRRHTNCPRDHLRLRRAPAPKRKIKDKATTVCSHSFHGDYRPIQNLRWTTTLDVFTPYKYMLSSINYIYQLNLRIIKIFHHRALISLINNSQRTHFTSCGQGGCTLETDPLHIHYC